MHSIINLASSLLLATSVVAQYGSGGGSPESDDNGGTPVSIVAPAGVSSAPNLDASPLSTSAPDSSSPLASETSLATSSATSSASPSEYSNPAGMVKVHVVKVSNKAGDLAFEPNDLKVSAGSMVQFHFYPKKHSVVQSTFDEPCIPINNVNKSVPGFFSGFMPVAKDATVLPSYTIIVNDTKPIWFYCSQGNHCQSGMVGVINAPAKNKSRTITTFTELASQAKENITPSTGEQGGSSNNSNSGSGSGGYGSGSGSGSGSNSDGSGMSPYSVPNPPMGTGSSGSAASTGIGTIAIQPSSTSPIASAPTQFTGAAHTLSSNQATLASMAAAAIVGLFMTFAL